MAKKRSQHSADFKFRLALEAAKGQHTLNELASQHGVHPKSIFSSITTNDPIRAWEIACRPRFSLMRESLTMTPHHRISLSTPKERRAEKHHPHPPYFSLPVVLTRGPLHAPPLDYL